MNAQVEQTNDRQVVRAIIHESYGEPKDVLRLTTIADPGAPGDDFVRVRITHRPVHPGDLLLVHGAAGEGAPAPISSDNPRKPGFEGAGVIEAVGHNAASQHGLYEGQRVAVFPVLGAWSEVVLAPASSVTPIPDEIADSVAAQILINVITARIVLRAAHNTLPSDVQPPFFLVQTAAGSAVGRLITALALELGLNPLRLVRSQAGAEALQANLPGAPIFVTTGTDWPDEVRRAANGNPIRVALDAVGSSLWSELASILSVGGSIVSYGALGGGARSLEFANERSIKIQGASINSWAATATPVIAAYGRR